MFKKTILNVFLFCTTLFYAQVGIGTTNPAPGAILYIDSDNSGVLIPRVNIVDLNTIDPITGGGTESLLVYNTNTTTSPGFYFWNGVKWERIVSGESRDWQLSGNTGTIPGTGANQSYIGTKDAQDLVFATSETERARLLNNGQFSVNGNPQNANDRFTVTGNPNESAIKAYASGSTSGVGLYAMSTDLDAVVGIGSRYGVYGQVDASNGFGIRATNSNTSGTGLLATGTGSGGYYLTDGSGLAGSGSTIGVYGRSTTTSNTTNFGGYFSDGTRYALVGGRLWTAGPPGPGSFTEYKILGTGTVSTLINDPQGTTRIMFAPESPEIVFQDYGIGQLLNGEARIDLDPVLKSSLHINENHPLKVFVTLEGDCNGVYVTNKSVDGFTVKELNNGTSNVSFSWQIVANRADDKDPNGNITSKHVGVRLPVGPENLKVEAVAQRTEKVKENKLENPATEKPYKDIRD